MFNKLKQFKDLRDQAKQLQNALAQEKITIDKHGLSIEMNGNMEIVKVEIKEELAKDKLEAAIKNNVNDAVKQTQRVMAQKMQAMGGLPGLN